MAYEAIPTTIIGIILLIVGIKLNMNSQAASIVRLGLILVGVVAIGFGIFGINAILSP